MKIIKDGNAWVALSTYAEKDIPKGAGFRWDPDNRRWFTRFMDTAVKLMNFAEGEVKAELEAYLAKKNGAIEASKAADADIEISVPEGLAYLPFQKAGISYALAHRNTLLADEQGLGKTIEVIGVVNALPEIRRVLVICPASLKLNWAREIRKWSVRPLTVGIVNGEFPQTDIAIVNYDILGKHEDTIKAITWDLLVVDECHRLKNPKAKRTQQVLGDKTKDGTWEVQPIKAQRRLFLSGTPIVNRPIELWGIVNSLAPDTFNSFWNYAKRYCNAVQGKYGWDMTGASHLDELQEKMRVNLMVRRLKAQVLPELPPKRRQVVELSTNGCQHVVEREAAAISRFQEQMERLKCDVEVAKAGTDDEYQAAVNALKEGAQIAFAEISKERHAVAMAKVPAVVEHLKDALEGGKAVCFAHHHDVIAAIAAEFQGEAVCLTGENSLVERQAAVDRFQSEPDCKLFIGSIQAAGVGIPLTAASHVVFAELDWVPGNVTQAEDRCHRIGQKDNVLVQHLVLDGSLDSRMAHILVDKQEVIDKAMDKEIPQTPVVPVPEAATASVSRKALEVEIPDAQIQAIHTGLRMLAGVCDGAVNLDGAGFNRLDTAVGKRLASLPGLTSRQASLGKVLLQKYHRQLPQEILGAAIGKAEA